MTGYKVVAIALVLVLGLTFGLASLLQAQGGLIGQALKLFGIAYVVRQFGPDINKFINNLTGQHGVKWDGTTKVVPIISAGNGIYVGAAQVQGPPDRVNQTRAIGQVETSLSGLRAKLLVPVSSTKIGQSIKRIPGVGVSALIDFKI